MLLARALGQVTRHGAVTLIDALGRTHRIEGRDDGPRITVRLTDRRLHWKLVKNPWLHVGEAYMDGTLVVEDGGITGFMEFLCANAAAAEHTPFFRFAERGGYLLRRLQQYNPIKRARANVAHHYDLSDDLYALFLDADRQYSCAYFPTGKETLEEAQALKKRHIAAKLLLAPGQRVLDIGCGWGGLGLYLARAAGVEVVGLTLSEEQHRVAESRARGARLDERVRFRLRDYREEGGQYDRIVSVGMFEHVGAGHYREFFRKTRQLLAEDGMMLLHSIGRMERPGNTNAWLRKYIFPGGYCPALSEVLAAIEAEGLWVTDIEILRLHYAETLRHWHDRFQANRARVAELYDERFCRMWEFYLKGCEMAFRYGRQMVFQMQIARRQDSVPLVRDYVTDWERAHEPDKITRPGVAA